MGREWRQVSLRLRLFLSRCFCTVLQTVVIGIKSFHRGRCKMKLAIEDSCVCVSVILPKQKHYMDTMKRTSGVHAFGGRGVQMPWRCLATEANVRRVCVAVVS